MSVHTLISLPFTFSNFTNDSTCSSVIYDKASGLFSIRQSSTSKRAIHDSIIYNNILNEKGKGERGQREGGGEGGGERGGEERGERGERGRGGGRREGEGRGYTNYTILLTYSELGMVDSLNRLTNSNISQMQSLYTQWGFQLSGQLGNKNKTKRN